MNDLKNLTPKQKREMRTGVCLSVACRERCSFFVPDCFLDGFPMCECGHTQDAHRLEGLIQEGTITS